MKFKPELAAKVMAGEKTVTRRIVSPNRRSPWWEVKCSMVPGKVVKVNPSHPVHPHCSAPAVGSVRVTGVAKQALGDLIHGSVDYADQEARLEGFADFPAFAAAWREVNGATSWDAAVKVWRIEFVVCEVVT